MLIPSPPDPDALADAVLAGDRAALGRAITLVESTLPAHRPLAERMLERLLPHAGGALRVGVSGTPGVGKSTFLERLGLDLVEAGHRVAVLAIDPSSGRTGGSILGDKTRMGGLAARPEAYIRPSPTRGALGGVQAATREALRVVESAGYDVVLVETVGVGQSEVAVAGMVDTVVLLLLAGAGDDLQGLKKGILEVVHVIAFQKADGDRALAAEQARRELEAALHVVTPADAFWTPPVLTCSALTGTGVDEVWQAVRRHREVLDAEGQLEPRRRAQRAAWMWSLAEEAVVTAFRDSEGVRAVAGELQEAVQEDRLTAVAAARRLVEAWKA